MPTARSLRLGPICLRTKHAKRSMLRAHVVAPGLIDLHVHVYWGVSHFGVEPDPTCIARGVTTVVDAGSAGADTFPGFRKFIIDVSDTRILAQLNISSQGMLTTRNRRV